jgi:hypothetical protein
VGGLEKMKIIDEFLENPCLYILAFTFVSVFGLVIGPILDSLTSHLNNPAKFISKNREVWTELFTLPEGGWVVGILERIVYLLTFLIGQPGLILGWLAFKLGAQFQAWATIIKVPEKVKGVNDLEYLKARKMWGDRKYQRFLLGTALNILISLLVFLLLLYVLRQTP